MDRSCGGISSDKCAKCWRFRSVNSGRDDLCSFHLILDRKNSGGDSASQYVLSFELYLRSRVGADVKEEEIEPDLSVAHDWIMFAASYSNNSLSNGSTNGEVFKRLFSNTRASEQIPTYRFFDRQLLDFENVLSFVKQYCMDNQSTITNGKQDQKYGEKNNSNGLKVKVVTATAAALMRVIEFRKFHLPTKGIMENPFAASERVLRSMRQSGSLFELDPASASLDVLEEAIKYHSPTFQAISASVRDCGVVSLENFHDLEFTTAFIATVLVKSISDGTLADFLSFQTSGCYIDCDGNFRLKVGDSFNLGRRYINKFTQSHSNSRTDRRSRSRHVRTSPEINGRERSRSPDCESHQEYVLSESDEISYIQTFLADIHPRLSISNDILLIDSEGLAFNMQNIKKRIQYVVFTATGQTLARLH